MSVLLEQAPAPAPSPRRRRRPGGWLAVLFVLIGVAVLLYPVAATQYNNHKQHQFAQNYTRQTDQLGPDHRAEALRRAREYNEGLSGVPILDPWLDTVRDASEDYREYTSQLSDTDAMARLRVPTIGVDLPVRHGTDDEVLAQGVGHLYGTSLPVGGAGTHAVLTSHTGLADATLFDRVVDLRPGDQIYVDVYGETLAYQVDQIKVVLPEETSDLLPVAGEDHLTLITCTPYAVNTHRLLVRAERVPYDPGVDRSASDAATMLVEPWMIWLVGAAAASLLVMLTLVLATRRRRRAERRAQTR